MTTVTSLTAERMLEIEAASVVDGAIVGDNLILEKHDGSTINAGNVRGPIGPAGPVATPIQVADAIASLAPTSFWKLEELTGNFLDNGSAAVPLVPGAGAGVRCRRAYRGSQGVLVNAHTPLGTAGDVYRFTSGAFSLLCLHRTDTVSVVARRLACKVIAGETIGWEWIVDTAGKLSFFGFPGPAGVTSDVICTLTEYNLYGYSNDGVGNGRVYMNGVSKNVAQANVGSGDASTFRISGLVSDPVDRGALGVFDCFAVWTGKALTQAEFDSIWKAM